MEGLDYSRPLSLYIHVPFCERKCDYCAFYSVPYCRYEEKTERYIDMLLGEIDALNRDYKKAYKTIFIGGGNPGILGVENLRRILLKASENGMAEETTIEINPENLDESILSLGNLITRISIGIQSMCDKSLRILGRNSDRENNLRALSLLSSSSYWPLSSLPLRCFIFPSLSFISYKYIQEPLPPIPSWPVSSCCYLSFCGSCAAVASSIPYCASSIKCSSRRKKAKTTSPQTPTTSYERNENNHEIAGPTKSRGAGQNSQATQRTGTNLLGYLGTFLPNGKLPVLDNETLLGECGPV